MPFSTVTPIITSLDAPPATASQPLTLHGSAAASAPTPLRCSLHRLPHCPQQPLSVSHWRAVLRKATPSRHRACSLAACTFLHCPRTKPHAHQLRHAATASHRVCHQFVNKNNCPKRYGHVTTNKRCPCQECCRFTNVLDPGPADKLTQCLPVLDSRGAQRPSGRPTAGATRHTYTSAQFHPDTHAYAYR